MGIKKIETFQGTNEQGVSLLMSKINALISKIEELEKKLDSLQTAHDDLYDTLKGAGR